MVDTPGTGPTVADAPHQPSLGEDAAALAAATESWDPQPVVTEDPMDAGPSAALAATLDRPAPDGTLPPLWHWVHFWDWVPASELGQDGHPAAGGLYPTIPNRTRMYLGGRVKWRRPLRIGSPARRCSEVSGRRITVGRSGAMLLVTVRHEISQDGEVGVVEEQDLMYRSGRRPAGAGNYRSGAAPSGAAAPEGPWRAVVPTDPVALFRFSALTANSHRIHYDRPYVTGEEGYPGLVVHGPLLALTMVTLAADSGARPVGTVRYRLLQPTFSGEVVEVVGAPVDDGAFIRAVVYRGDPGSAPGLVATTALAGRAELRWS